MQFSQRRQPLLAARSPAVQSWQAGVVARLRPPIAHSQEDRLLLFPKALPAGPNDCDNDCLQMGPAERACGRLRAKEIVRGKACCGCLHARLLGMLLVTKVLALLGRFFGFDAGIAHYCKLFSKTLLLA